MTWLGETGRRARFLFRRGMLDRELDEEMRLHLELLARERAAGQLPEADALSLARRAFGNLARIKEESVRAWQFPSFEAFGRDIRYAVRALGRNPVFASMAILSLALGTGANLAVFSTVYSVLLRPLPYDHPDDLVSLSGTNPSRHWTNNPVSGAVMTAWKERNHVFRDIAAYQATS